MKITYPPIVDYVGDGITKRYTFPFDYLRKAFVKIKIDEQPYEDFEVDGKVVVLAVPPARDTKVEIYRETLTTRLVSWADASVLRAKDMNISDVQVLHLLEEQQIWTERNAVVLTEVDIYNFYNRLLENVADPVNDGDVVTLGYFKDIKTGVLNEINNAKNDAITAANTAKQESINASTTAKGTIQVLTESATSTISGYVTNANNKYQENLGNLADASSLALSTIDTTKTNSVSAVNTAKTEGVGAVNSAKTQGVTDVNTAKTTALSAIDTAKTDAVNKAKAWAEENAGTTPSLIGGAKSSKQWAESAKVQKEAAESAVGLAQAEVSKATAQADRAKTEADRAATEASKVDMSNYYSKTETDNRYLKLSGGTMTSALETNSSIAKSNNTSELNIFGGQGWTNGAVLTLRGKNNSYLGGSFSIGAYNAASDKLTELVGKNDGSLAWNTEEIERVVSKGDNYIRYANGVQLCWGITGDGASGVYYKDITLPAPYITHDYSIFCENAGNHQGTGLGNTTISYSTRSRDLTTFRVQQNNHTWGFHWFTIGRWK